MFQSFGIIWHYSGFSIRIFKHLSENARIAGPSNRLRTSLKEIHPRSLGVHLLDVVLLAGTSRDNGLSHALTTGQTSYVE